MTTKLTPFNGIDGESIDDNYCLLSTNNDSIEAFPRLSTLQCLSFIMRQSGILVGFSFHFDACHILRDLPPDDLKAALHGVEVKYRGFTIRYLSRKLLIIRKGHSKKTIYDTWGFFQKSFIGALESLGFTVPDLIKTGKQARGDFKRDEFAQIKKYNTLECVLLSDLMGEFRERIRGNFKVRSWHGAGAISQALLRSWHPIARDMAQLEIYSNTIKDAFDASFYGGRIELMQVGSLSGLHCYDINSAYPAALSNIPTLPDRFKHTKKFIPEYEGVYRIKWDWASMAIGGFEIAPFPVRTKTGLIVYPLTGEGWYTSFEVREALNVNPKSVNVFEGWVFKPTDYSYKNLVNDLYETRAELKRRNDGAQIGYKLGLNSLYGKLAQKGGQHHHPILKTFITGWTRAKMFNAASQCPKSIVSFATDGIVSTEELSLTVDNKLGNFEYAQHDKGLFIMSGIYKLDESIRKVRGFRKLDVIDCAKAIDETGQFNIQFDSFVSPLLANKNATPYTFHTFTKQVRIYESIKRDYDFLHCKNPHRKKSLLKSAWGSHCWYTVPKSEGQVARPKPDYQIEE